MNFPRLKTGAVGQYPAKKSLEYRTEVLRFVDGSEQRYRQARRPAKRWLLSLRNIDEQEACAVRELFQLVQGGYGSFSFEDPWDGTRYEECSLGSDELELELEAEGRFRARVQIVENGV